MRGLNLFSMKFCIAVKPCFFEVPYGKSAYAGLLGVDVYDLHRGSPSLAPSLSVRVVVTGDGKEKSYRIGSGVAIAFAVC